MPNEPVDRRDFGRMLATGTAGLALGSGARGEEPPVAKDGDPPPADSPFGPPPPAVLMVEYVRQRYPHDNLTVEVLEKIESDVQASLFRGERLSRYPFHNSDEPATLFAAFRAEG